MKESFEKNYKQIYKFIEEQKNDNSINGCVLKTSYYTMSVKLDYSTLFETFIETCKTL